MKLVTGIEAIQSGKPWRHKDNDEWIDPVSDTHLLTPRALQTRVYIIKEEPKEFWICINSDGGIYAYPGTYKGADTNDDDWIRVREVEK